MTIRTPRDLGAAIRDKRRKRGLDQQTLALKIGVSRQWISEVEKGKPRAEVGLILRALDALGIALAIVPLDSSADTAGSGPDIDRLINKAREPEE